MGREVTREELLALLKKQSEAHEVRVQALEQQNALLRRALALMTRSQAQANDGGEY